MYQGMEVVGFIRFILYDKVPKLGYDVTGISPLGCEILECIVYLNSLQDIKHKVLLVSRLCLNGVAILVKFPRGSNEHPFKLVLIEIDLGLDTSPLPYAINLSVEGGDETVTVTLGRNISTTFFPSLMGGTRLVLALDLRLGELLPLRQPKQML